MRESGTGGGDQVRGGMRSCMLRRRRRRRRHDSLITIFNLRAGVRYARSASLYSFSLPRDRQARHEPEAMERADEGEFVTVGKVHFEYQLTSKRV